MIELKNDTYLISDLHMLHKNIIKHCDRPFETVEEQCEKLLAIFDSLPQNCTVWNLGDVFSLKRFKPEDLKKFVDRMRGNDRTLNLILGNHDNCSLDGHRVNFYKEIGFDKVYDTPIIVNGNIILSHEPVYFGNSFFTNYHGHIHEKTVEKDYFTYDFENYAEQLRLGEPLTKVFPERIVDPSKYVNVCWDFTKGFTKLC